MQAPTKLDWFTVFMLGMVWGGTFMVVSFALRGYGPITVACARVVLGAAALLALGAVMRRPFPGWDGRLWAYLGLIGLLNSAVPFTLLSWGQQFVPSAFAGLSMASVPLFVLPMAFFFADEPLGRNKLIGFGLGFLGALILLGPDVISGGPLALPRLACIAAALCYASASVLTRRCPPIDPISLAAITLSIGAIPLTIAMLMTEGVPVLQMNSAGLAIVILGLVPTALAILLRVTVIRRAGAGFMTLTAYQIPVWSMLFGGLVLGEVIPLRFIAALGLILIGLLISQKKPKLLG